MTQTLSHIMALGEQAEQAGEPLVQNWPQTRASLHLINRAIGLDHIPISSLFDVLPERFDDLRTDVQARLPGRRAYNLARRQASRLVAVVDHAREPWEALRMLIRSAGRKDIETILWALTSVAKGAGLAPSEIRSDWIWAYDAEYGVGHQRQTLRRSVVGFDQLFEIDIIVASGLLPPRRIGPPPVYDRLGRPRRPLPPTLLRIHESAARSRPTGLKEVWQVICASKTVQLPDDPSADDVLAPDMWSRITALPLSARGVRDSSWTQYLRRARATLQPYATEAVDPDRLPSHLAAMASSNQETSALRALWRRVVACGFDRTREWRAGELLEIEIWRAVWRARPDDLSDMSIRQYEILARRVLIRQTSPKIDPRRRVQRAWTRLPKESKVALATIRKMAERALLRPSDVTPVWLDQANVDATERATACAALADLERAVAEAEIAALPDPVADAWRALRSAAQVRGFNTSRLGAVRDPAIQHARSPRDIDRAWAIEVSDSLPNRLNARFRMMLRNLDEMRADENLAPQLYPRPIGELPDRRRKGNRELPQRIARELERVGLAAGHAPNTRRDYRSLVRTLYTHAVEQKAVHEAATLQDLLRAAPGLGIERRKVRKATNLLDRLAG